MSDSIDSPSHLSSEELALSKYEDELERLIQENLTTKQDFHTQKLFLTFQNAATNLTKMFRERSNETNHWQAFHTAAESVTMLYKESLDALKEATQVGILTGEQRKTKDILRWTRRKQRRHIRTEELYDSLIGRPPYNFSYPTETGYSVHQPPIVDDLHTFRQALVMDDNNSAQQVDVSADRQLESFVRQQVADQQARKRDYYSIDSSANDLHKSKRPRYTH